MNSSTKPSAAQRRRSVRVPSSLEVSWTRRGVAVPAVAADINEHGLFVFTTMSAHPGELLPVRIELPGGAITAIVIARFVGISESGEGIGAELFVISDDDHLRWCRYYQAQLRAHVAVTSPSSTAPAQPWR